jgi:inner membrane protein
MGNTVVLPGLDLQGRLKRMSVGVKLILICLLALLMTIPALFLDWTVDDRTGRAAEVTRQISADVGGPETFLGPTLAIPYSVPAVVAGGAESHGIYLVSPVRASARLKIVTEERRRSLFMVPIFRSETEMNGSFDLTDVPSAAPANALLAWNHAEIVVGVTDARGAVADATLKINGKTEVFTPARTISSLVLSDNNALKLMMFGVEAGGLAHPGARFDLTAALTFSGAQRIAMLAYGKTTDVTMQSDWASPGFDGEFLPVERSVTKQGFAAKWSVPFIARGVRGEGDAASFGALRDTALGVSFIEVADPYQSVSRSLKYVLLFVGLVFLAYFVFEVTTGKRVHPAQYLLVGAAQLIFYLLLLSLAERIGFGWAFLFGGGATVLLLAANAQWVFQSRREGIRAFAAFAMLYTMIYLLLRLEDNALLIGAGASFAAVATAMYFTRKIDWYGSGQVVMAAPPVGSVSTGGAGRVAERWLD